MSTSTVNFEFLKPEGTDTYDVDDLETTFATQIPNAIKEVLTSIKKSSLTTVADATEAYMETIPEPSRPERLCTNVVPNLNMYSFNQIGNRIANNTFNVYIYNINIATINAALEEIKQYIASINTIESDAPSDDGPSFEGEVNNARNIIAKPTNFQPVRSIQYFGDQSQSRSYRF